MILFDDKPADRWEATYPVGNGSLGVMVWGDPTREVWATNEESLWSGYPRDRNNPGAFAHLEEVRQLVFAGRYREAEAVAQKHLLGEYGESYLPLGNVVTDFPHAGQITDYRRSLDLETAVAEVSYRAGGHAYRREVFASFPAQAVVIRLTCDAHALSFSCRFESQLAVAATATNHGLLIEGRCPEHVDPSYVGDAVHPVVQGTKGLPIRARLEVISCDGAVTAGAGVVRFQNASSVVLAFSAVREPRGLAAGFDALLAAHIADYRALYSRVELDLGPQPDLPTAQRLERFRHGEADPGLFALYFQYGRYLLISSSRDGSLPANLQGLWSWELRAPWSSNWTTNINTQMNYWLAQVGNLKECLPPYFDLVAQLTEAGKTTARVHYGCRGSVHHHNADRWGSTHPVGIVHGETAGRDGAVTWSLWPMGGVWMTSELWRHHEYNPDPGFLRNRAYPLLREAVLFLVDWLVERDGVWVTVPSTSPENRFLTEGGTAAVAQSCALDLALVREAFTSFQKVCGELGLEDELLPVVADRLARLAPFQVGSLGQLLEWHREFPEAEPGHRHLSHLYGLFPGELFAGDERLTEACRVSLERRLAAGSGHTGWSCAWVINLYAVLGDGEGAYRFLTKMLVDSTYPNLWDAHPPFQIDGNFGGAAGLAHLLVQDRGGQVTFLPALPRALGTGSVKGLRIKGGKTVDLSWKDGVLVGSKVY